MPKNESYVSSDEESECQTLGSRKRKMENNKKTTPKIARKEPKKEFGSAVRVKMQMAEQTVKDDLLECIRGSNLDTAKAALILWDHYQHDTYDAMEYQSFLSDIKVIQIAHFDAGAPLFHPEIYEHPQAEMLMDLRNMIKSDILLSLSSISPPPSMKTPSTKIKKESELRCSEELTFTRTLLDDTHVIPEDEIFREMNIREFLLTTWGEPSETHTAYEKCYSAVKHILGQICKIPENITQYTHTFWGISARKYSKLPDHILKTLGDMMLQVTGLDDPLYAVKDDTQAKQKYPAKWLALGPDDRARSKELLAIRILKDKFTDARNRIIIDALTDLRRCDFTEAEDGKLKLRRRRNNV